MQYPLRNKIDGTIYLQKGHFGIRQRKYLYALLEFVKGSSLEDTAKSVSRIVRENVSKTMIKETFRVNLIRELSFFSGDDLRISITEFCRLNSIPISILKNRYAKCNQQKMILFTIYLREVFDLKPPLEIKK